MLISYCNFASCNFPDESPVLTALIHTSVNAASGAQGGSTAITRKFEASAHLGSNTVSQTKLVV